MTSSHSFHSLEAEKEPISFTFGHIHTHPPGTIIQRHKYEDPLEIGKIGADSGVEVEVLRMLL